MATPQTMKAFKCLGQDSAGVVDAPVPALRPDYILVKVSHVALNPTDWKHVAFIYKENATVGCDYSGTVVAVGKEVQKNILPGARVAGVVHGTNAVQVEDGSFGEYLVAKGDVQFSPNEALTDEEAATFGVGIITIGQGLYQALGLPFPGSAEEQSNTQQGKHPWILIYGASSAMGLIALQYAKLSGFKPIAVCSKHNFDLVKQYGAVEVFDYKDGDATAKQIRELTNDDLRYAFDCISENETPKICAGALTSKSGVAQYSALLPVEFPRSQDDVKSGYTLGYTVFGEAFTFAAGAEFPAVPEDFEFAKTFVANSEALLQAGKIKPVPIDRREGGLNAIQKGLDDLRNNRVSGRKIVYKV